MRALIGRTQIKRRITTISSSSSGKNKVLFSFLLSSIFAVFLGRMMTGSVREDERRWWKGKKECGEESDVLHTIITSFVLLCQFCPQVEGEWKMEKYINKKYCLWQTIQFEEASRPFSSHVLLDEGLFGFDLSKHLELLHRDLALTGPCTWFTWETRHKTSSR